MIMKTWNDYKEHVRTVDPEIGKDIDEIENISTIVSAIVEQRTSLGLSQRELTVRPAKPTIWNQGNSPTHMHHQHTRKSSNELLKLSYNLIEQTAF